MGKEFWVPVTHQSAKIYIVAEENCEVQMSCEAVNLNFSISLNQGEVYLWSANPAFANNSLDFINPGWQLKQNKIVHVESTGLIQVKYETTYPLHAGGSTMIYPVGNTGSKYTLSTYKISSFNPSSFSPFIPHIIVIAEEDSTVFSVNPTHDLDNGYTAGTTFQVSLNKGEAQVLRGNRCQYLNEPKCSDIYNKNDLSGTTIEVEGCKKVSVFLFYFSGYLGYFGNNGDSIPVACCSESMIEQYLPDYRLGNEYIVVPIEDRTDGDVVRIMSLSDENDIYMDGTYLATLSKNETYETLITSPAVFSSDRNITVFQYIISSGSEFELGDPEITQIVPINYTTQSAYFSYMYEDSCRLSIITETEDVNLIFVDGVAISPDEFESLVGKPSLSAAFIPISSGSHEIHTMGTGFQAMHFDLKVQGSRASYVGFDGANADTFSSTNFEYCLMSSENDQITLAPSFESASYLWSNNTTSNRLDVNVSGTYWLKHYDDCGVLLHTDTFNVFLIDMQVDIRGDSLMCDTSQLKVVVSSDSIPYTILWSTGETTESIEVIAPVDDSYSVLIELEKCYNTLSDTIFLRDTCIYNYEYAYDKVNCNLYVPNTITLDNNGLNEEIMIKHPPGCYLEKYELLVFNRWGDLLFSSIDVRETFSFQKHKRDGVLEMYIGKLSYQFEGEKMENRRFPIYVLK